VETAPELPYGGVGRERSCVGGVRGVLFTCRHLRSALSRPSNSARTPARRDIRRHVTRKEYSHAGATKLSGEKHQSAGMFNEKMGRGTNERVAVKKRWALQLDKLATQDTPGKERGKGHYLAGYKKICKNCSWGRGQKKSPENLCVFHCKSEQEGKSFPPRGTTSGD